MGTYTHTHIHTNTHTYYSNEIEGVRNNPVNNRKES